MRKIYIPFIFLVCLCSLTLPGYSQIVVDGDLSDWDTTRFNYDDQNKLWYDFRKDQDFLYIALLKNENAIKIKIGGIQLAFDPVEITDDSFRLTFAHRIQNTVTGQYTLDNYDYLELSNWNGDENQQLPIYNETGISAIWTLTNIEYYVIEGNSLNAQKTPANPNIFRAEVQVPLSSLPKAEGVLAFSICLRGGDLEKNGKEHLIKRNLFPNYQSSIYMTEMFDTLYYTEFFGTLELESLME